jgi:hypothetical protein
MQVTQTTTRDGEDRVGPRRDLLDAARSALRAALGAQLRTLPDEPFVPPPRLRRGIRLLCDQARRHGVRAEQLVVAVREAWSSLPESRWRAGADRGSELIGRVVAVCIDEFYAGQREDARGDAPASRPRD